MRSVVDGWSEVSSHLTGTLGSVEEAGLGAPHYLTGTSARAQSVPILAFNTGSRSASMLYIHLCIEKSKARLQKDW
jgi:hypothetical protein